MTQENEQGKVNNNPKIKQQGDSLLGTDLARHWLDALIESADDAIISKTLDSTITSWNKGAERIFGYTADEVVGNSILILIPPELQNEEPEILERIKAGERVEHFETVRLTKDGRRIDISLTISPIKNSAGEIIGASKIAREITDFKRVQRLFADSEERYRTLFNSIDEGFCVIQVLFDENDKSVDYRFLELNPSFIEQTGMTDAAPGKTMRELIPNHDDSWFEIYGRVALTGEPIRFENYAEILDRWFDLYAFRIGEPESRKVAVIFKNITDRKRGEENLRKSDTRLRLALDIARTGTFEIDLITDQVETDALGRGIYGFEKDELLTFAKVQSRFHPDDFDYVMQSVATALEPNSSGEFEIEQRIIRTNGETRWIRVLGRIFFDGEGKSRRAVTCLGTYIDITHQKQDEDERLILLKKLEAERARLQYLFTSAPAFVATLRGAEHIFELTNPAYLQLIGHRDIVGKSVGEALPEVLEQGFLELLDTVFKTGEPYIGKEIHVMLQREAGGAPEERFLDFVYQPIFEENGSVSGIFVHGIDITDQVQSRKDAENANRAKDEFLATLSHELRTPINAILGWSRMMTDSRLDEKTQRRALETIHRNAQSQTQLIEDILDVSRIVSGKLKLETRPVELSSIIEAAIESVLPAAQAKELRLQKILDSGGGMISGDPNRLQQIIWNILANAVKFTPKGGRIQIRLERINSHIEIIVTDTGIGISPKTLPFIFDRFSQAESATTRKYGGLGLGLAIVRHLVEMHGGSVEAESEGEGHGSIFTVKLPLITMRSIDLPGSIERIHPSSDRSAPFNCTNELDGLYILVVDDEEDGRALITTVLEQCGATVKSANSVQSALEALQNERFDILLSDIGMPEEDGYTLIRRIRSLPFNKGGKIPAAALTAFARVEDRMRVLRAGFQIHIPKPVEPAELIAVVANLAGRHNNE